MTEQINLTRQRPTGGERKQYLSPSLAYHRTLAPHLWLGIFNCSLLFFFPSFASLKKRITNFREMKPEKKKKKRKGKTPTHRIQVQKNT